MENIESLTLKHCERLTSRAPEGYTYTIDVGRKYYKIVMNTAYNSRSAHAFVDKKTGAMYKVASWAAPAKGIRYYISDTETLDKVTDWASSYLYR